MLPNSSANHGSQTSLEPVYNVTAAKICPQYLQMLHTLITMPLRGEKV